MINWENFVVLSTPKKLSAKLIWDVSQGQPSGEFFLVESCTRSLYATTSQQMSRIPTSTLDPSTVVRFGQDAYSFLVKFYTGLESRHLFELHDAGRLRQSWNNHRTKHPQTHKVLIPYMDAILHDSSLIRSSVLASHTRRPSLFNTAVEKAALAPDKNAMIICDDEIKVAEGSITAMGHFKAINPGTIKITHPNPFVLDQVTQALRSLPSHRVPSVPVTTVPFDEALASHIYTANALFVGQPMTDDTSASSSSLHQFNQRLISTWLARCQKGPSPARLIHLRGNPDMHGETTGLWRELSFERHGFVSLTQLKEAQTQRRDFILSIAQKAEEAIETMAESRLRGDRLVKLDFNAAHMELAYHWARRPLGVAQELSLPRLTQ